MTDLRPARHGRIRTAASRIFGTAPIAWLVSSALLIGLLANALTPARSNLDVRIWLVPMLVSISLLAMWARFSAAGVLGRWARVFWSAASVAVGAGIALTTYQSANPHEYALPFLAIPAAIALLAPLGGSSGKDRIYGRHMAVWTRGSRLLVRFVPLLGLCLWVSLLAGFIANTTVDAWAGLASLAAFLATFVCTATAATLGVFSYSFADPKSLEEPLSGVEFQLTEMGFTLASLATVAGSFGLFLTRALTSGQVLTPNQLDVQAFLLVGLSVVGPAALFLEAPFVCGNDRVRGTNMHRLGRVMRLFAPAFVVLVAWSGPAVVTEWDMGGWTGLELIGVCLVGASTAYCVLRTVFELLDVNLPLWVLPTLYAVATVGAGVLAV
jgi:hypothetical protein